MSFNNIIGNDSAKETLLKSVKNNTVLHSYMFIGESGIGKKLIAEQFAKMILCENFEDKECNSCKSCIEFQNNNNPNYIYIEPVEGKSIKIEQIRQIQSNVYEKPVNSGRKIYIINDADLMTKESQNCLLKTLEEPPKYIVIILIVNNESRILNTIKSRCTKINFKKIDDDKIKKFLYENCNIKNVTNNILRMCNGSIGKCLSVKDKIDDYNEIENMFSNINNFIKFINSAEILYKNKNNISEYLEYINVILYQNVRNNLENSLKYINTIKIVENVKERLLANSNYDMCVDYLLFNIWEEFNEGNNRS